jgi:hypothetical protein
MKHKAICLFLLLSTIFMAGIVSAQAGFTLKRFVPLPGVGDYQIETKVTLHGRPPQLVSQLVCIETPDPAEVLQGLSYAENTNQVSQCIKTVLKDTETVAIVENRCDGAGQRLTMDKPSTDLLRIKIANLDSVADSGIKAISDVRWLRRPCTVKSFRSHPPEEKKPTQLPQATAAECKEMNLELAKLRAAGKSGMPAGALDQALRSAERIVKAKGCVITF